MVLARALSDRARIDDARQTIERACTRLMHPRAWPSADSPADLMQLGARVAANNLMELQVFTNALLDAVLPATPPASSGYWRPFGGKLLFPGFVLPDARCYRQRLVRLRRSWASLRYCNGVARSPDTRGGDVLTAGWSDPATGLPHPYALGESLVPTHAQGLDICDFYLDLTDAVIANREIGIHAGTPAIPVR